MAAIFEAAVDAALIGLFGAFTLGSLYFNPNSYLQVQR